MNRAKGLRILRPVVVLVLGVIGFAVFVPQTVAVTSRMSRLVVTRPSIAGIKFKSAAESQALESSAIPLAEVKKAQAAQPAQAGAFVRAWTGPTKTETTATVLVSVLPDDQRAVVALGQAEKAYIDLTAKELKTDSLTRGATFSVPGVPGSRGGTFAIAKSSSTPAGDLVAVTFRVGRVVAVNYLEATTGHITQADASALARSEYAVLSKNEPGFSMAATTLPLARSLGVAGGTVVVALAAYFGPELQQRRRHRHSARQAVRARYEYRARGRKVVNRQRTPSWAQRRH